MVIDIRRTVVQISSLCGHIQKVEVEVFMCFIYISSIFRRGVKQAAFIVTEFIAQRISVIHTFILNEILHKTLFDVESSHKLANNLIFQENRFFLIYRIYHRILYNNIRATVGA